MRMNLSRVAEIAPGERTGADIRVTGVSIDSRRVKPGDLFIPLTGERTDGHDFAAQAMRAGAAAFLWERGKGDPPADLAALPHVRVDSSLVALQKLARARRDELPVTVVGVTGSNGKTATKDLIAAVAAAGRRTVRTPGNLNSQIGLPLTILGFADDAEVAVLEMGMTGPGHIASLCRIARPDTGVITIIGEAHLEFLRSRSAIARAKWELIESLPAGGLAVLPDDEPLLDELAAPEGVRIVRAGETERAGLRLAEFRSTSQGCRFRLADGDEFELPLPGRHLAHNALRAIAVGDELGIPRDRIREALRCAELTGMRTQVTRPAPGVTLINDAYNAAPASVRAALAVLTETEADLRIAVLGDMLELGPDSPALHAEAGRAVAHSGAGRAFFIGEFARDYARGAGMGEIYAGTEDALSAVLAAVSVARGEGRTVALLVKGSRRLGLERLADELTEALQTAYPGGRAKQSGPTTHPDT
jgi:UDP-N-acetylmuramoyl-tripeptide--D-alanyl-D-alanine ligase